MAYQLFPNTACKPDSPMSYIYFKVYIHLLISDTYHLLNG